MLRYFHQPSKATTNTIVVNNSAIQTVSDALSNKVDKSAGRGLSQNNYSAPEKNKLGGIEEGAEVNVQADWDEEDITSDAYIKNKPTIQAGVTGVKGDAETTYRRGNVNLTATNIGLGNVANIDQSKAIKSITRAGTTFTYTCLDGTIGTFTQQDNNTTYSGSSTVTLNGTTFSITKNNIITALGYTPAEEGASEDYLPLTGGTVTGPVEITNQETVWFLDIKDITSKNIIGSVSGVDTSTAKYFSILAKSGYDCEIGPNNGRYLYMKASTHRGGIGTQDPSYKFEVVGTVGANDFVNRSDIRDKNIIQQYNIPITAIAQAPAFAFTWKNNEEDSSTHIGSSAQYWKEVVPEAVKTADDDKGTLSMQYDVLALLSSINIAKTIIEMQNKIDTLEKRIQQLEQAASK